MENDRDVVIAFTIVQVDYLAQQGWRLVETYQDAKWADVADAANGYAFQQGKRCPGVPRVLSGTEYRQMLAKIYSIILSWPKREDRS